MKSQKELKALQRDCVSRLSDHGLKFALVDRHTYMFNKKRGLEEVKKNASLSLKKLEAISDKQILVGLTGTGVDVIIKSPTEYHALLDAVYVAMPGPLVKAKTIKGEEIIFVHSMGIGSVKLPGIVIRGIDGDIALPEADEWLPVPKAASGVNDAVFAAALSRWQEYVANQEAVEHDKQRERSYLERREQILITGQASLLKKSLRRIKGTDGWHAVAVAHKQAFHIGHHTDDNPRLNKTVIQSILAYVTPKLDFTPAQIVDLELSLEHSLKSGIADQRKGGRK